MFSIARTILMCQKQIIHTFYLKNGLQNICGNAGREYSKYVVGVLSTQKCYHNIAEKYTFRFYCSTPTLPKQPPSSMPQGSSKKSDAPMKALVKKKKYIDNAPRIDEYMIMDSHRRSDGRVMTAEDKLKEFGRTQFNVLVILIGGLIILSVMSVVLYEFFSANSPANIYSSSFKLCKQNTELQDALGMPMKCYGEETRRGYRRHVAHEEFVVSGIKHIRMKYYIQGAFRKGTVHLEKIADRRKDYDAYSYLIVDLDGYPPRRIIIDDGGFTEDNDTIAIQSQ